MVRRADRVITCRRYMRSHVAEVFGVGPAKITAIPNGIDPRDLEPVADDLDALRARYAEPHERLVLLVVGWSTRRAFTSPSTRWRR